MTLPTLLAILAVVVALPLNWIVTVLLWRLSRASPEVRTLRERAIVALAVSVIVTVFSVIFVNNEMEAPPLNREATMILSRGALLALSVIPSVYWLRRVRR